jgi:hypothetical protein
VPPPLVVIVAALLCHAVVAPNAHGQLTVVERLSLSGTVEAVTGERVTIRDESGTRLEVRVQKMGAQSVSLADGRLLAFPAEVRITGPVDPAKLKPGQVVRFRTTLSGGGVADGELTELAVVDAARAALGVVWPHGPPAPKAKADGVVTAAVLRASRTRLAVELPAGQPFPKKTVVFCSLADGIRARLESHDLKRLEPAATVSDLEAVRLDTGDLVATLIVAENPTRRLPSRGSFARRTSPFSPTSPTANGRCSATNSSAWSTCSDGSSAGSRPASSKDSSSATSRSGPPARSKSLPASRRFGGAKASASTPRSAGSGGQNSIHASITA